MKQPCVLATQKPRADGYTRTTAGTPRKHVYVHRLAYIRQNGAIPDGLVVDHLCHVRNCVNTAHMQLVTQGENARRHIRWGGGAVRGSKCTHGMVRLNSRGDCRDCHNEHNRKYNSRKLRNENGNTSTEQA